ncbi:hypothetical protein FHR65_004205 [Xanthomonas arboricola]|uniref:Uncharacterized protein n=1 Tax=Xanthomonas arboricola TaxID=56448 RepID=A0AB73H3A0_9XANT|nr:hypothetical protein [Xanthomonas euvesicatoria]MBB5672601.1 hypothetical protein [Xanthomonas arboricola]
MSSLPFFPISKHQGGALVGALASPAAVAKNPATQDLDLTDLPNPPPSAPRLR